MKRAILLMNGQAYRHWRGSIPGREWRQPFPVEEPDTWVDLGPVGSGEIVIRTAQGERSFWFGGDVKYSETKTGRSVIEIVGKAVEMKPVGITHGPSPFDL